MEARQTAEARHHIAALYQAHALGLVKLAVLMVGDQLTAEDVVQDAFLGLYRRWPALQDQEKALSYVHASVLNGCRMIYRGKYRRDRVRLTPGSIHPVTLTRLPIPGEPAGTQVSAIALAPGGSELAVMSQQNVWSGKTGPLMIRLYSLATGTSLRTWTVDTKGFPAGFGWYYGRYSNTALTWLDGGRTLAVIDGINSGVNGPPLSYVFSQVTIRTVDAGSPSGNLLASGKVVFHLPNGADCDTVQLTDDGKTVLCGKYGGNSAKRSAAYAPKFVAYSVATGKSRLLYQLKGAYELGFADVLWASPTGSALLGAVYAGANWPRMGVQHGPVVQAAGLLTKGTFKPVRFPLTAVPFAGDIAF